jgi:hypothetical protein
MILSVGPELLLYGLELEASDLVESGSAEGASVE